MYFPAISRLLSTAVLGCAAAAAHATVIDFSSETVGVKPNGYTVNGVTFSDSMGANLRVDDYGLQSLGNGLAVFSDDTSRLQMSFGSATAISLDFGNDDPNWSAVGNLAVLRTFLGSTLVGGAFVVMNRDDLMNQSISFSGATFDSAEFYYADANFAPIGLVEIVDNVSVTSAVPEPESYALMLAGLGVLGFMRKRRQVG